MLSDIVAWFQGLLTNDPSPQEKLDRAQRKCRDKLQELKQAIADITTQKKKLELQRDRLSEEIDRQEREAKVEVNDGNESVAKDILKHKRRNKERLEELREQISNMAEVQQDLTRQKDSLKRELRDIKTTRSNMEARKKAAEAEMVASEAFSGRDGINIDETMRDLESKTQRLETRAEVARESPNTFLEDEIETEEEDIEKELEELKN